MGATATGPGLEVWERSMGVTVHELSGISAEVYRAALANLRAPASSDPRDLALWKAGRFARACLLMAGGPNAATAPLLASICGDVYRAALANLTAPATTDPRDFAIWKAARYARAVLSLDRGETLREQP